MQDTCWLLQDPRQQKISLSSLQSERVLSSWCCSTSEPCESSAVPQRQSQSRLTWHTWPHRQRPRRHKLLFATISCSRARLDHAFASIASGMRRRVPLLQRSPQQPQRASSWGRHLLSGGLSAAVCRTTVAPLERLKLEMVLHKRGGEGLRGVARDVWRTDGLLGFWRGNGLNILRTAPYKAVNFFSFDLYRKALLRATGNNDMACAERFTAGALAGMTATVTCFPLDVLRTRMMGPGGEVYGGILSALRQIVRQEGVGALYVGVLPALASMAPAGACFYGSYDWCKESVLRPQRVANGRAAGDTEGPERLTMPQTLLFGAFSGATTELLVYPMEVIRRRMQLQAAATGRQGVESLGQKAIQKAGGSAGIKHAVAAARSAAGQGGQLSALANLRIAAATIARQEGVRGFYAGLAPNMLQVLPNAALSYFTYEMFKQLLKVES